MNMNEPVAPRATFDLALAKRFAGQEPLSVAVAYPCDAVSMQGVLQATRQGIIKPVLVGPLELLQQLAQEQRIPDAEWLWAGADSPEEAAEAAVRLAQNGQVQAIMKGSLHTDVLMRAVVAKEAGLRTSRRMSHVFAIDHPGYHKLLLVTDAALNIAPDLDAKRDITQNAINLAHQLGVACPKVAILAAVETVDAKVESTMHAAALTVMAARGQLQGAQVDGPLAFDNAISKDAAAIKGIVSPVAGDADILVVPNYEVGNVLAKEMEHLGGAHAAGLVLGAKVPVILTSRSDSAAARVASCLLALAAVRGVQ